MAERDGYNQTGNITAHYFIKKLMMNHTEIDTSRPLYPTQELSFVVIPLLKGVIYEEDNQALWSALLNQLAGIRDYVAVLGLELIVDEAEGYAFLRSQPETGAEGTNTTPRLMARRQLSYPVSLLLALLLAQSRTARRWFLPLVLASQAIPVFAIAPLLVLWFGFGIASKVAAAALIIFFPVTSAFYDGLVRTERGWLDLAHGLGSARPATGF